MYNNYFIEANYFILEARVTFKKYFCEDVAINRNIVYYLI